jgi:solute carrier family 35 protein E1
MPTSISTMERRSSSSASRLPAFKFPGDSQQDHLPTFREEPTDRMPSETPNSSKQNGRTNGAVANDRWQPRKESYSMWSSSSNSRSSMHHGRQKSLGDALRTIKGRRASVSANAQEIADALKAPVSPKLIVIFPQCTQWTE